MHALMQAYNRRSSLTQHMRTYPGNTETNYLSKLISRRPIRNPKRAEPASRPGWRTELSPEEPAGRRRNKLADRRRPRWKAKETQRGLQGCERPLKLTRYGCPNLGTPIGAIIYLMKIIYVHGVGNILNRAIHILH